nr:acetyl-CoA C-acyltransferase FadA [Candidatus Pantoea persica]
MPATTVNRLCGSSMQALHDAARAIIVGDAHACLVGGVEHMGHVPMNHGVDFHPGLGRTVAKAAGIMGLTAEMPARMHYISHQPRAAGRLCAALASARLGGHAARRLPALNRADLRP